MRSLSEVLPRVAALLDDLNAAVAADRIGSTETFIAECRTRWSDALMAEVDAVIPHWSTMASFADGKTLWHVTEAMVALIQLDEYVDAEPHVRRILEWTVLLHDVAKEPGPEAQEHRHAFRSAALAARYLPDLKFGVKASYATDIEDWCRVTDGAHLLDDAAGQPVQDNRYLAEILGGADRIFDVDGARVIKAIALHLSLSVVADWPSPAPLTAAEEHAYITPDLATVLLPLMLADSGGWNLFDASTLQAYYAETRGVFARIAAARA